MRFFFLALVTMTVVEDVIVNVIILTMISISIFHQQIGCCFLIVYEVLYLIFYNLFSLYHCNVKKRIIKKTIESEAIVQGQWIIPEDYQKRRS